MRITKTNDLKIYPTKQSIDKPLGIPSPLEDKNKIYVVTGSCGTGKSTWLNSAMTCLKKDGKIFAGCFERVYYATPEECFSSEENHPFKNHVKTRLFHNFDEDMLKNVMEQSLENKHIRGGNNIFLIDDFSEELKNLSTIKVLKRMINKHRHHHMTIVLSALTLESIPKGIRRLIDYYVIFKPKGLIELEGYTKDIFSLSKRKMLDVLDFVFDEPHNFLMYANKQDTFFKNFDEFDPKDDSLVLFEFMLHLIDKD